jgi:hypothetical protein
LRCTPSARRTQSGSSMALRQAEHGPTPTHSQIELQPPWKD